MDFILACLASLARRSRAGCVPRSSPPRPGDVRTNRGWALTLRCRLRSAPGPPGGSPLCGRSAACGHSAPSRTIENAVSIPIGRVASVGSIPTGDPPHGLLGRQPYGGALKAASALTALRDGELRRRGSFVEGSRVRRIGRVWCSHAPHHAANGEQCQPYMAESRARAHRGHPKRPLRSPAITAPSPCPTYSITHARLPKAIECPILVTPVHELYGVAKTATRIARTG